MPGVAVIIPTLNEVEAIGPGDRRTTAIDGAGDYRRRIAAAPMARKMRRAPPGHGYWNCASAGYGRACAYAAAQADEDCDIIVFMDGDGADRADLLEQLVATDPGWAAGICDCGTGAELAGTGLDEPASGCRRPRARLCDRLADGVCAIPICAPSGRSAGPALNRLAMREMTYGWNIEMQMKAAQQGLRILEIPLPYRCRAGGQSKVAGSVRGSIRASWRIVTTFMRVASFGKSLARAKA